MRLQENLPRKAVMLIRRARCLDILTQLDQPGHNSLASRTELYVHAISRCAGRLLYYPQTEWFQVLA
jgi:hypothetical protein